jgi:phosphatidylglycerol:prolipoprotein diacylglycerol transferase
MHPIIFPGLGLTFTINRAAFSILGLPIYWYGILIAFGFALATFLALRDSKKYGIKSNDILDLLLFALPAAIVGARLYYVIFSWSDYQNNLLSVFDIHQGGLAIYGGVIAALITAYRFAKKRKIGVLKLFDFTIPYLALGQAIGRWGNFVNQEAHGVQTSLPWRMQIFDTDSMRYISVHPTFLYESLWDFSLFLFLIWFRKRKKLSGEVFTLYLAIYGLGRCFIEGLRTDSLYLGPIRISQLVAGGCFIIFITIFIVRRIKLKSASKPSAL